MMKFDFIENSQELAQFIETLADEDFVTVDTEFIREKTYYSEICLIQIASSQKAVVIDMLQQEINFAPLFELLLNPNILKVLHACRQDMEIFYELMHKKLPTPIFDTQIAAMVCGFGAQVGYEALVNSICNQSLNKANRHTDWKARPLTHNQISYAAYDVIWLRDIYLHLKQHLDDHQRQGWIEQELQFLTKEDTYTTKPEDAWLKIKFREKSKTKLGALKTLAAWRESEAKKRNLPRSYIVKDDLLVVIAQLLPETQADLLRIRGVPKNIEHWPWRDPILKAVSLGIQNPVEIKQNKTASLKQFSNEISILKFLLKLKAESIGVVPRIIASDNVLQQIAVAQASAKTLLNKWQYDIFGRDAQALLDGKASIGLENGNIMIKHCKNNGQD